MRDLVEAIVSWRRDQQLFKRAIQEGLLMAPGLFRESRAISAEVGLHIYQESHEIRLRGFLLQDFPVLSRLLNSRFTSLARKYRLAHPSRSASGTDYGCSFADFLAHQKWTGLEAAAPDLAKLEWSLLEILYTTELASVGFARVASATEKEWSQAKLLFDPSCRMMRSRYPLDEIYEQELWQDEQTTDLVLWRKKGQAFYRRIDATERHCLTALSAGLRLGDFSRNHEQLDPALFSAWIVTGLLKGIQWA